MILAIDPSLRLPGFALYDGKNLKILSHKMKSKYSRPECLIEIERILEEMLKSIKIDYVVIEEPPSKHSKTNIKALTALSTVCSLVEMILIKHKIKYEKVLPVSYRAVIRKHLDIKTIDKSLIPSIVSSYFNQDIEQPDQADASALIMYYNILNGDK